jgi:exodeoxyribonuclease-3
MRNRWSRDAGLRLDHILLSPDLRARLKAAGIDKEIRGRENASDHAPVWIDLSTKPGRRNRSHRR